MRLGGCRPAIRNTRTQTGKAEGLGCEPAIDACCGLGPPYEKPPVPSDGRETERAIWDTSRVTPVRSGETIMTWDRRDYGRELGVSDSRGPRHVWDVSRDRIAVRHAVIIVGGHHAISHHQGRGHNLQSHCLRQAVARTLISGTKPECSKHVRRRLV